MAAVPEGMEPSKFGEGPFEVSDLKSLSALVEGCPWRRLALPGDHPVYARLKATFAVPGEADCDKFMASLDLLANLSHAGENIDSCHDVLAEGAAELDTFVSQHLKPTGRGADDEILAAMFTILLNVSGKRLDGVDALNTVNGKISAAVAAFTSVFRQYHHRLPVGQMLDIPTWREDASFFVAAIRTLYELSQSHTLYLHCQDLETDRDMVTLDAEYRRYMTSFNKAVTEVPVFDYIGGILDSWFELIEKAETIQAPQLLQHFQMALKYTLQLLSNMLTTTHQFSAQLKSHIAKHTRIIQNVALPYMHFALDILERRVYDPDTVRDQHIMPLALVVKVVSLISYKIRMFRPWLAKFPLFGARLAKNETILQSELNIEWFALVVRFIVNAELTDSIPEVLATYHATFNDQQKGLIAARLTSRKEKLYPVNVFTDSYNKLRAIFEAPKVVPAGDGGAPTLKFTFNFGTATDSPPSPVAARAPGKRVLQRRARGGRRGGRGRGGRSAGGGGKGGSTNHPTTRTQRQRLKFKARYASLVKDAGPLSKGDEPTDLGGTIGSISSGGYNADSCGDDDDEPVGGAIDDVKVSGAAMLSAADAAMQNAGPVGDDYTVSSSVAANKDEDKNQTQKWFGEGDSEDESEDEDESEEEGAPPATTSTPPPPTEPVPAPAPPAPVEPQGPPAHMVSPTGIDLSPWRSEPPAGVPTQYLCALSRRLILIPVLSPSGDVFDKATILDFLKKHKRTCPITGDTLYPSDLVVDNSLRREIDAVRNCYI